MKKGVSPSEKQTLKTKGLRDAFGKVDEDAD